MLADRWDFKTSSYAGEQQAAAWSEVLSRVSFALASPVTGQSLQAAAQSRISPGGAVFARIAAAAHELRSASGADDHAMWLVFLQEGRGVIGGRDDEISIEAGDIVIGAADSQARLSFEGHFRGLFVRFPGEMLARRTVLRPSGTLGVLPRTLEIEPMFAAMLDSIARTLEKLSADAIRIAEGALAEFLVAALPSVGPASRGTSANQALVLQRICRDIETRLSDPDLTLTAVAEEQGLSPRYLQKLFEAAGDNFGRFLRRRRLERCRDDLVNPTYAQVAISEVGFRWGFNDAAHFTRAFREQFGATPRDLRASVASQSAGEAVKSATRGWPEGYQRALRKAKSDCEIRESLVDQSRADVARSDSNVDKARRRKSRDCPRRRYLAASDQTIHWGYLNRALPPALEINSGDVVTVETLTQHAYDDFERMIEGDSGAESVFLWTKDRKAVDRRGAGPMDSSIYGRGAGEGFGVHICTGPIAIAGAEPGDIVEVRIQDILLRPSANPKFGGKTYGSNVAAWWGFHHDDFLSEPRPREVVTIYEISDGNGGLFAKPLYNYRWTPQRDPFGVVHPTMDYPGVPIDPATIEKNFLAADISIPARLHFGFIALAPKEAGHIDSVPPAYFGGNLDNWRLGKNAKIFLPVSAPGGLLSIGDPHAAQGDGEVSGTAIEASLTGIFEIVLHKRGGRSNPMFADLDYPVIETEAEWIVHGFSHPNYLSEFGESGQSAVYKNASLNAAMRDAFRKMRRFVMTMKGLSEDEAISLISAAVDFCVTQVVDGNLGVHAILRKELFGRGPAV